MTRTRILSLVAIAALVGGCGSDPVVPATAVASVSGPSATPSHGPTVTAEAAEPLPAWTWTAGTVDGDVAGAIVAIWPLADGFAAVATRVWSDEDDRARATFLISDDGLAWGPAPFPRARFAYELGVTHDEMLTVFGTTGPADAPRREIWQTTDGSSWTRLAGVRGLDFGPGLMQAATPSDNGWLAVGTEIIDPEHRRSHLLISKDLRRWRELPWPDGVLHEDIASDGTHWGMFGSSFSSDDAAPPIPLEFFRSADGITWTPTIAAQLPTYDSASSLTAGNGIFAIGGQRFDPADESSNPIAWWSSDGMAWQPAEIVRREGAAGQANMNHVAGFTEGFVGTGSGDEEQVGLWLADDGRLWTQVTPPDGMTQVEAAALTGPDVIVSGWVGETPLHIWRGTPDR